MNITLWKRDFAIDADRVSHYEHYAAQVISAAGFDHRKYAKRIQISDEVTFSFEGGKLKNARFTRENDDNTVTMVDEKFN